MDNIGLSTIVLFILAAPAYVARRVYYSHELETSQVPKKIIEELISIFFISIFLHIVSILFLQVSSKIFSTQFDLNNFLNLIIGNPSKLKASSIFYCLSSYTLGTTLLGSFLAVLIRKVVWHYEIDLMFPAIFGIDNFWINRLTGRGYYSAKSKKKRKFLIPIVEVLIDNRADSGETVVYRGVWLSFSTNDNDGSLAELVLSHAQTLNDNMTTEKEMKGGKGFENFDPLSEESIRSILIIPASHIVNLKIIYFDLPPQHRTQG